MCMGLKSGGKYMKKIGECYADKDFWDRFNKDQSLIEYDPDAISKELYDDLKELYHVGNMASWNWEQKPLSPDSIGNMFNVEKYLNKEEQKKYLMLMNTIGGKIIFPKHRNSINQARGFYKKYTIGDRFDYTLECIRRYYFKDNSNNPLFHYLDNDRDFFNKFGKNEDGFNTYVEYFYLNKCLVVNGEIQFFLGEKSENIYFNKCAIPEDENTWFKLYNKTMEFVSKRNKVIKKQLYGEL